MKNQLSNRDWIYLIFFLSGASGLMYETVWLRILIRILGNTVYATSIILAAFMAGLALGSLAIDRLARKKQNLLRLYAYLELGIGLAAIGLLLLFQHLLPVYKYIYQLCGNQRLALTLGQSLIMFILLLAPTFLMGGTFPLLSSYFKRHVPAFTNRMGYLYGFNTLGAVVGVLGSGLIFIGLFGELRTTLLGVALNLFAAYIAYSLSREETKDPLIPSDAIGAPPTTISPYNDNMRRLILMLYMLSGFTALAYEVVWTRMFQIYVGTSIYAFSLMLAFYLIGLGLGSLWGARAFARINLPIPWFGWAQGAIALYSIAGLYLLAFGFQTFSSSIDPGGMMVVPLVIVTPITFLLGITFPAICKSFVKSEHKAAHSVGQLYAANTIGCIAGSLICGFIFIAAFGTKGTILLLAGLNLLIGLSALAYSQALSDLRARTCALGMILMTLALGFASPDPFLSIINQHLSSALSSSHIKGIDFFYHKESSAATTTAFGFKNMPRAKALWVNGQAMTGLGIETKLMAHLPLLLHPQPKNLLVICFGMGTTLRSAWTHQGLKCDTVELVPEVYDCFKYFHKNGPQIFADQRVRHFVDDGRNFLLMHSYTYDVITIDPAPPIWSAGSVNLYSRDFMILCKNRLNPGGIMCLWVPPAQYSEVVMIMKTFQAVFPNTYVWRSPDYPGFYLIGLEDHATLNLKRFDQEARNPAILADLNEWHKISSVKLLKQLLLANPNELRRFLGETPVITDDIPYTEFPLWRSLFDRAFLDNLDANYFTKIIR